MAVSALAARPDVDPHRIAVLGFSMGSFIASLTGAADARVHALFVTGGGDLDGPSGYWDQGHAIMCQAAPYKALRFLGDRGAVLFTLSARRGDTFLLNGTADTVVAIPTHGPEFFNALRKRVIALNGSERGVFTTAFDPGASHRPSWVTPLVAGWLNQELRFPAWRNQDVAKLPTQTIRAWAGRVGYALGKSSGREDRDAGIVALTADVPLLTAEELDVLPRTQWEQQKSDFLYTSWLTRAAAAAAESPCCHVPRAPWPLAK
jgi:pimeloyl-ACP methyl ester carboxylesterase